MKVQYITDEKGVKTGVLLNMKEWDSIQRKIDKYSLFDSIQKGLKEVKQIEQGKLKGKPIKELLNQL